MDKYSYSIGFSFQKYKKNPPRAANKLRPTNIRRTSANKPAGPKSEV